MITTLLPENKTEVGTDRPTYGTPNVTKSLAQSKSPSDCSKPPPPLCAVGGLNTYYPGCLILN